MGAGEIISLRDPAGRRGFSALPDGVGRQIIYDDAHRIERITYFQGGQELERVDYSYDAAGQRIGVQSPGDHHRLPPPLGGASYDLANRLTDWNGVSVSHDPNGNLTQFGSEFYGYDARDRLRASVNSGQFITYTYDGAGRRIRRDLNGGEDVRFHYQGANLLRELNPNGQARAEYLNGEGLDAHISRDWLNQDERHVYLTDAQNTTLSLVEAGNPGTAVSYAYEPFGQTAQAGSDRLNRLEYTGRERDPNGLYYLRARYYHPRLQRFIAEDPIGFQGGDWNLYGYVGNDPVNYMDPTGLFSGIYQEYHAAQARVLLSYVKGLLGLSTAAGVGTTAVIAAPAVSAAAGAICRSTASNPRIVEGLTDFLTSTLPATAPSPTVSGFFGATLGAVINPQEILR